MLHKQLISVWFLFTTSCNAISGIEDFNVGQSTEETTGSDSNIDGGITDTEKRDSRYENDSITETIGPIIDSDSDSISGDSSYDSTVSDSFSTDASKCGEVGENACGGCGDICTWNSGTVSCKEWLALKTCSLAPSGGCIKCSGPNSLTCEKC